jgi:hypothetical protein
MIASVPVLTEAIVLCSRLDTGTTISTQLRLAIEYVGGAKLAGVPWIAAAIEIEVL